MATDIRSTAERGRRVVARALRERGAEVNEVRDGSLHLLDVRAPTGGRHSLVRVRVRTSGTWQGDIRDGDPARAPDNPRTFWVFVSLEGPRSEFFIVPDGWMRENVAKVHREYLARHGGERPVAKDSTHHAIQRRRIEEWRGRWDLLGLEKEPTVTGEIRIAEEQVARGEGVEHDQAVRGVIAHLRDSIAARRGAR